MATLCGASSSFSRDSIESIGSNDDVEIRNYGSDAVSPFEAYDDGYKWPNLFEEIDEMMEQCVLIWPMAELRKRYREDKVEDPSGLINKIPLTSKEISKVVDDNMRLFAKFTSDRIDSRRNEQCMEKMDTIHHRRRRASDEARSGVVRDSNKFTVLHLDDQFQSEELVYWLAVDHKRKRLTVTFRGASNRMDWVTASELYMKEIPNPMKMHSSQPHTLKIHHGFHNYLFSPSSHNAKGLNGLNLCEYEEILQDHVIPELKRHQGYKLYVTGHSLGGALATLFAFEAASEPDAIIPKPVTCISIGSPYVGDESFRGAHQLLEGIGKLRHLRLTNHKDVVTIIPKVSFRWNLFDEKSFAGTPFKHVGMNLRLYTGETPFDLSFPKIQSGIFTSTLDELTRGWENSFLMNLSWNPVDYFTFPHHTTREYNRRLTANKVVLETVSMNDLYSNRDIVGNLVAQF